MIIELAFLKKISKRIFNYRSIIKNYTNKLLFFLLYTVYIHLLDNLINKIKIKTILLILNICVFNIWFQIFLK